MKALVTGGAGFIGSFVSEALAREGWDLTVLDDLSSGSKDNLENLIQNRRLNHQVLFPGSCTNLDDVKSAIQDCEIVFHFAANPEVRMELNDPEQCFQQNVYGTHNILEALRRSKADTIVFASTSTVYGDARALPTPEDYAPLEPISIYGASKLAGEALVISYCHTFDKRGVILRFANVVGPRSKHGVVSEFISKLEENPRELSILGDGTQNKSYIFIDDAVKAIQAALKRSEGQVAVFNVGSEDSISVTQIGMTVARAIGLDDVDLKLDGGLPDGRGWIGDVKTMLLDISKLKSVGWRPRFNSRDAVEETVKRIVNKRETARAATTN